MWPRPAQLLHVDGEEWIDGGERNNKVSTISDFVRALSTVGYADPLVFHDDRLWFVREAAPGEELAIDAVTVESFVRLDGGGPEQTAELFALKDAGTGRRGVWLPSLAGPERQLAERLRAASERARASPRLRHLLVVTTLASAHEPLRFAGRIARASRARLDVLLTCSTNDLPASAVREAVGWQRARLEDAILTARVEDVAVAEVVVGERNEVIARYVEERSYELVVLERAVDARDVRATLRSVRTPTVIVPPAFAA
jgi:hypothetical protein